MLIVAVVVSFSFRDGRLLVACAHRCGQGQGQGQL